MQKLTIYNGDDELNIDNSPPYTIAEISGISDIPLKNTQSKGYGQNGAVTTSQCFEQREIGLSINIIGEDINDVYLKRRELVRVLNPMRGVFKLKYSNDYITKVINGRLYSMPVKEEEENRLGYVQKLKMLFVCDDPFWQDEEESFFKLTVVEDLFSFPLSFSPNISFGEIRNKRSTVINEGDVDTPLYIEWIGTVTNPIIINEDTNEFIRVKTSILEGEKLIITTGDRNKKVKHINVNGVETNAFGLIDLDSRFFSLVPGGNSLNYDADSGADSSSVTVKYVQRYVGL